MEQSSFLVVVNMGLGMENEHKTRISYELLAKKEKKLISYKLMIFFETQHIFIKFNLFEYNITEELSILLIKRISKNNKKKLKI